MRVRCAARHADGGRAHDVRDDPRKTRGRNFSSGNRRRARAGTAARGGEAQALFCADDFDPQRVAVTIARLEAVLEEGIARAQTREAHLLEERFVYEPFKLCHSEQSDTEPVEVERSRRIVPQLRLLEVREVPVQVRGGEPAVVDRRAVLECVGPWRIAERSFIPSPVARDEYDVVLEDGTFARIYRQGAHWYLRGVYE